MIATRRSNLSPVVVESAGIPRDEIQSTKDCRNESQKEAGLKKKPAPMESREPG
jgi:hypothetical protein